MQDRISENPGRVLITPENGSAAYYATMTRADNPTQNGDPLNKNTLLKDATAALFGLGADAVPDDVLNGLSLLSGASDPDTSTVGLIGQMYYNTTARTSFLCYAHVLSGSSTQYMWTKVVAGNEASFGTRGPIVFTSSGTFNASLYGLVVGDKVNVICIGGGGAGGGSYSNDEGNCIGGAAGKAGADDHYMHYGRGGGGGAGYGAGGGGAGWGDGYSSSSSPSGYTGAGGGGSGYLVTKTVELTSLTVPVTVGVGGTGVSGAAGNAGGASSFGSYVTAAGGSGGKAHTYNYGSANGGYVTEGAGGHAGGRGGGPTGSTYFGTHGGGGGGGWIINSFVEHTGTPGENATSTTPGSGGTNGGAPGQDGGDGKGVVFIWY